MTEHRATQRRPRLTGCGVALMATALAPLALAGCSSADQAGPATTVTVTATTGTSSGTSTPSPTVTSDVKGRSFDLGTVNAVSTVNGTRVVELDRWTVTGTSDSTLAKQGLKVVPHKGSRYTNQNSSKTYTAPVAAGARVVVNTCVPGPGGTLGITSSPVSASSWLTKPDASAVLLVTYDKDGFISRLDTDPGCPG